MELYIHLGKGPKSRKLPESCKIFREKWAGRGRKQDQEMRSDEQEVHEFKCE